VKKTTRSSKGAETKRKQQASESEMQNGQARGNQKNPEKKQGCATEGVGSRVKI